MAQHRVSFGQQFFRKTVAFPEFKREFIDGRLIGDGSKQEAAIGFQVVVLVESAAPLKRQVFGVHEIFMELIRLRIYVIDSPVIAAVYNKHHMRQRVKSPPVVNARKAVKICARVDSLKRASGLRGGLLLRKRSGSGREEKYQRQGYWRD